MPSTYSSLSYHVVFSTKNREPLITKDIREQIYQYIGGIIRTEGGSLTEIGGVEDHIHLLIKLKPTHCISDFMRILKANASKWINEQQLTSARFAWQEGYSIFTVSQSQVEAVRRYLQRQESHHAKKSFRDELQGICERHGVTFDAEHF